MTSGRMPIWIRCYNWLYRSPLKKAIKFSCLKVFTSGQTYKRILTFFGEKIDLYCFFGFFAHFWRCSAPRSLCRTSLFSDRFWVYTPVEWDCITDGLFGTVYICNDSTKFFRMLEFPSLVFYVNSARYASGSERKSLNGPPCPPHSQAAAELTERGCAGCRHKKIPFWICNKSRTSAPITSGTHRFKKRIKMKRSVLAGMIVSKKYYKIHPKCYKSFKSSRILQKTRCIFSGNDRFQGPSLGKLPKGVGKIVQKMYGKIEKRHCRLLLFSVE